MSRATFKRGLRKRSGEFGHAAAGLKFRVRRVTFCLGVLEGIGIWIKCGHVGDGFALRGLVHIDVIKEAATLAFVVVHNGKVADFF